MRLSGDTDLKKIVRLVHEKGVVTASYLRQQGVSYQSMLKYRMGNWLASLGTGAFCESGTTPSLDAAIVALSEQLGLPVHIGGKTALLRRGIMQHVPVAGHKLELYLRRGVRIPKWFSDTFAGQFVRNASCLFQDMTGVERDAHGIPVSSPERAYVEMAAEVPRKTALGELYQLMEFADTLRPRLVTELLSKCGSVKAKRVFLLLADDLDHWWFKKIDRSKIDLGTGCRMVERGGTFQSQYNIIVKPWREY